MMMITLDDLEFDFGEQINLPQSPNAAQEVQLRKLYKDRSDYSRKNFEIAVKNIALSYYTAYRTPIEITVRQLNAAFELSDKKSHIKVKSKIGFNLKNWTVAVRLLFFATLLSFMICIIWIGCVFIFIL